MNLVYGFKDDASSLDDEDGEVGETVQKYHRTLNRLKREVGEFKEETQNNIIDLRSTIYVLIYLRVQLASLHEGGVEDVMFYMTKNHEIGIKSAILVAVVTPVHNETQLVRLHGRLSIKSSEDLTLHVFSTGSFSLQIMDKNVFTMYIA